MPLVNAQCTNCGGFLEVESTKDAAICPHCGTPYIVEKAINNYSINNTNIIQNATISMKESADELWNRALRLYEFGEIEKADDVLAVMLKEYIEDPRPVKRIAEDVFERCKNSSKPAFCNAVGNNSYVINRYFKMFPEDNLFITLFNQLYDDCLNGTLSISNIIGFLDYKGPEHKLFNILRFNAYKFNSLVKDYHMRLAPKVFKDLLMFLSNEIPFDDGYFIPFITFSEDRDKFSSGLIDYGTTMYMKELYRTSENLWSIQGIIGRYIIYKYVFSDEFMMKKVRIDFDAEKIPTMMENAYSSVMNYYDNSNICVACGVGTYGGIFMKCWSCGHRKTNK